MRSVEEENIVRVCSLRLSRSVSVEEEKIGRVCPHRSVCGGEDRESVPTQVCLWRRRRESVPISDEEDSEDADVVFFVYLMSLY